MVDSHIHLTDEIFANKLLDLLEDFSIHDGKAVLNIAHNIEAIQNTVLNIFEMAKLSPVKIYHAFGIHPTEFDPKKHTVRDVEHSIRQLKSFVTQNIENVHAIGECGFDFYRTSGEEFERTFELQDALFESQIALAAEHNLPLILHVRDKANEDIAVKSALAKVTQASLQKPIPQVVFHSYTGSPEVLKTIVDAGYFVGFNAIITYPSAQNVRELLKLVPLTQILLETDAPYLPTQNTRRSKALSSNEKFGRPTDILEIAQIIADVKGEKVEKVLEAVMENFGRVVV